MTSTARISLSINGGRGTLPGSGTTIIISIPRARVRAFYRTSWTSPGGPSGLARGWGESRGAATAEWTFIETTTSRTLLVPLGRRSARCSEASRTKCRSAALERALEPNHRVLPNGYDRRRAVGNLQQHGIDGIQVGRHLAPDVEPENDSYLVRGVLRVVEEGVVEHHSLTFFPMVRLAPLDERRVAPRVVVGIGIHAQPAGSVDVVVRDQDSEVVTQKSLPVAPVGRDVLPTLEHGEKGCVQARDATKKLGGTRRERAVLFDEPVRLEHERLPGDGMDASGRVLAGEALHVDQPVAYSDQRLALAPDVGVPRLEGGQPGVVALVAPNERGGTLEH